MFSFENKIPNDFYSSSDFIFLEQTQLDTNSYASILNMNISIVDFSPEWDYLSGGAKVLFCINPFV